LLAALLDGPMPRIPLDGVAAAGELAALGHLVSLLPADDLDDGERAALLGGAPCSAALAGDAAVRARPGLELAVAVFALSVEAMNAPLDAYHPALREMGGDRFITEALVLLSHWLAGAGPGRRPYQAPVSYRVMPQVLGAAARAVDGIEDAAGSSLSAVTADPVYLPPGSGHPLGAVVRNGGAHNA